MHDKRLTPHASLFLIVSLILTFFLTSCEKSGNTQFKEITTFAEIDMSTFDKDTLVLLDADETLIQPTDAYLINEHTDSAKAFRERILKQNPHIGKGEDLLSVILLESRRPLLDSNAVDFVNKLHEKEAPVIGCTGMNTGKHGRVDRLEKWRYDHMTSLSLNFSFHDKEFKIEGFDRHPLFYKGILVSDLNEKGPIVKAFLKKMALSPKVLVMVDDKPDELLSIQKACQELGIIFHGYLFKGAKKAPWDEGLAQIQADYLIKHAKWLNDAAALEKMRTDGVIISTDDHDTIKRIFEIADKNTLLVFDADDVLMQAKDQALKMAYREEVKKLEALLEKKVGQEKASVLFSTIFLQRGEEVVDPALVTLVHDLQSNGLKTVVLTSCSTGPFGKIQSLEDWRISELKSLGYHFEKSWPGAKALHLENDRDLIKDGVIFSAKNSKGNVLESFLKHTHLKFQKIIFIDDKIKNIISVRDFCRRASIPFVGIEYTAFRKALLTPLNKERIVFQFRILEEETRWLSDKEAEKRMKEKAQPAEKK